MRNRLLPFVLLLALLASGFGCASMPKKASGPVFTPAQAPSGKAVVYFFRTDKFMMSGNTIFMSLPKAANNCFGMVTAGYYPFIADPGKLIVSSAARDGEKDFAIDLKAGDERYVKIDFNDDMIPKSFYQEIPAGPAKEEISRYRLIEKCKE